MAGEGDCDGDEECEGGLVCGDNNCRQVSLCRVCSGDIGQSDLFCSLERSSMKKMTVV